MALAQQLQPLVSLLLAGVAAALLVLTEQVALAVLVLLTRLRPTRLVVAVVVTAVVLLVVTHLLLLAAQAVTILAAQAAVLLMPLARLVAAAGVALTPMVAVAARALISLTPLAAAVVQEVVRVLKTLVHPLPYPYMEPEGLGRLHPQQQLQTMVEQALKA